jgi:hypothetical protein
VLELVSILAAINPLAIVPPILNTEWPMSYPPSMHLSTVQVGVTQYRNNASLTHHTYVLLSGFENINNAGDNYSIYSGHRGLKRSG